jgi:hypothetical protein
MEAELELRARLLEQRRLRTRNRLRWLVLPFLWIGSLISAVVDVGRNRPEPAALPEPEAPGHGGAASLDMLPAARPRLPTDERATGPVIGWAPPPQESPAPVAYEAPAAEVAPPPVHPEVEWPDEVEAAPEQRPPTITAPHKDWRPMPVPLEVEPEVPPLPAPPPHWPDEVPAAEVAAELPAEAPAEAPAEVAPEPPAETPAPVTPSPELPTAELTPEDIASIPPPPVEAEVAAPVPAPLPAQPTRPLGPGELAGVILSTCIRSSGAEVGVLVLLQDDVLVVRASAGVAPEIAAKLALETLGDLCLDVIGSVTPVRVFEPDPGAPDPYHPRAILCVPVMLAEAGAGAVLVVAYAPGHQFSAEHERLLATLARTSGPVLARAGAYQMVLDRPGDAWRRLDQATAAPEAPAEPPMTEHATGEITGSPMSTMTLDPEAMHRLIEGAKAARVAQEAEAATEAAVASPVAPPEPVVEEPPVEEPPGWAPLPEWAPPPAPVELETPLAEEPIELPEPAQPAPKKASWRDRVGARMTRVTAQQQEENRRYRAEILAAIRNLSWDGYQALIADIYRRKAFEVFPPPVSGSDLDVIDLVVDRDSQRMLINCQLRGEMDIPAAAVTEMGNVVSNYSVAGAYLIADGSFAPDAEAAAPAAGVTLIDGEALIDLVIETTLKDESKPSGFGKLMKRFAKAS